MARYYDCVSAMDQEVGDILKQLKADGLSDDTIVFFYSAHGSGMPRHKRALLDSGMRVAMMVYCPEKWSHLVPTRNGTRTDRLVSFVDFGPTALSLAGVDIPDYMEGKPFLGKKAVAPRRFVYGHRDRVDEVQDLARSIRDKRYLYIRNFMPHLGYNQPTAWPDLGEIRHEFYRLTDADKMTSAQWHFAGPSRPLEELYDCQSDPQNLKNLADSGKHSVILKKMRRQLAANIRGTRDLGFLPEARAWELTKGTTPWNLARDDKNSYNQQRLVAAARQVGNATTAQFVRNLRDKDAGVRFWGAVGLSGIEDLSVKPSLLNRLSKTLGLSGETSSPNEALLEALKDESITVRIEAANALARHGNAKKAIPILTKALESRNLAAVQHAARTVELLGATAKAAVPAMKACDARMKVIRPPGTSPVVVQPEPSQGTDVEPPTPPVAKPKTPKAVIPRRTDGYYISTFTHFGRASDGEFSSPNGGISIDPGTTWGYGIAVGLNRSNDIRMEVEASWKGSSAKSSKAGANDLEISYYSLMINAYKDFDAPFIDNLDLYTGLGLGWSVANLSGNVQDYSVFGNVPETGELAFAYQFMVGANYRVSDRLSAILAYRLFNTGSYNGYSPSVVHFIELALRMDL